MSTPIPTDRRPREPRHGLRPSPTDSAVPPLAASPVLDPPPPVGGTAGPYGGQHNLLDERCLDDLPDRLRSNIVIGGNDECWEWQGNTDRKGYGKIRVNGEHSTGVHRIVWAEVFGPIEDGLHVMHRCDNPPCCNPSHLRLGTNADNVRDMLRKGRQPRGETKLQAKISAADVMVIRAEHAGGVVSQRSLATRFGVSPTQIGRIVRGEKWAHTFQTAAPPHEPDSDTEELQRHLNEALFGAIQARELLWDIAHRTDVVSPDNARVCDRTSQAIDAVRVLSELARDVRADARRARG